MKKRVSILVLLFFLSSLLVPTLFINKLLFVLILFSMLIEFKQLERVNTISPFVILGIFLFGFIISSFSLTNIELRNQFVLSVSVLFLIYPIVFYRINMDWVVKLSGMLMVIATWFLVLCVVVFKDNPLAPLLLEFFTDSMSGGVGMRGFTEETSFFFHLGTAPFLYLPFCLHFMDYLSTKKKKIFLYLIVLFITMWLSSSRGLVVISILSAISVYLLKLNLAKRTLLIMMSIPVGLLLLYLVMANTSVFDTSEESNRIKIGHVESFFNNLNGANVLIGDGLASYYYSKGSAAMKAHTEVTPIDMLRYFGFLLTPLLYLVIFFPFIRISEGHFRRNEVYLVIFILYVINSFTNPTMFNSYGLLVVLWYWSKLLILPKSVEWISKPL